MMSGVPLETCWAFNKLWNNKFYYKAVSCWYFYWVIYDARIHEYQIYPKILFTVLEQFSFKIYIYLDNKHMPFCNCERATDWPTHFFYNFIIVVILNLWDTTEQKIRKRKLHILHFRLLLTHWGWEGSFKLFKRPFLGFLTFLTL